MIENQGLYQYNVGTRFF